MTAGTSLYSHMPRIRPAEKLCNAFDLVRRHKFNEEDYDVKLENSVTELPSFKGHV